MNYQEEAKKAGMRLPTDSEMKEMTKLYQVYKSTDQQAKALKSELYPIYDKIVSELGINEPWSDWWDDVPDELQQKAYIAVNQYNLDNELIPADKDGYCPVLMLENQAKVEKQNFVKFWAEKTGLLNEDEGRPWENIFLNYKIYERATEMAIQMVERINPIVKAG